MKKISLLNTAFILCVGIVGCKSTNLTTDNQSNKTQKVMTQETQKQQVTELLKAIETGAAEPVGYINAENYKQHNLAIADGTNADSAHGRYGHDQRRGDWNADG